MNATPRLGRSTDWMLARFAEPPFRGKLGAISILVSIIIVIGGADALTGIHISLGVFYLVPLILATVWLGERAGFATAVLCTVVRQTGDFVAAGYHMPPSWSQWNAGASFVSNCLIVWILNALFTLYRELDQRVKERTNELEEAIQTRQVLETELLDIGARERTAIGRELHDDLCQHLVGTAFAAKVLAQNLKTQEQAGTRDAQTIVNYLEEGIAKTRALARGLLLANMSPEELINELAELVARGNRSGIKCRFIQEGIPRAESGATAAQLFRIAQEAMRNALRHASPKHVDLTLTANNDSLCLIVQDDGCGLPASQAQGSGMGLKIMAHRAAFIGAAFSIVPAQGQGTRIVCLLSKRLLSRPPLA